MATQSADVERACKVHKLVHTRARNRMKHKLVTDLVFCYVNLRLMKKVRSNFNEKTVDAKDDLEDFLCSGLDQFEEEYGDKDKKQTAGQEEQHD